MSYWMKKITFLILLLMLMKSNSWGQESEKSVRHYIKAGSEIPLQYAIQYEMRTGNSFSVNAQFGVLTDPYNDAIIFTLESFGVDDKTIRLIENAFQFGLIIDVGVNYHFGKNYMGVYGQWINLTAADTPFELVENYLGISFPIPPFIPDFVPEVSLQSELFQLGLLYGRRFSFKNHPAIEIHTEFAVSKNLGSRSKLSSENVEVDFVNDQVDKELDAIFSDYAYIPTLNIFFVYQFGKLY